METVKDLSQQIVTSIARAIQNGDPFGEIVDMFVATPAFTHLVQTWTDGSSGLGLLQLAVISNNIAMVRYLCEEWKAYLQDDSEARIPTNPPFLLACKLGSLEMVQHFLTVEAEKQWKSVNEFLMQKGIMTWSAHEQFSTKHQPLDTPPHHKPKCVSPTYSEAFSEEFFPEVFSVVDADTTSPPCASSCERACVSPVSADLASAMDRLTDFCSVRVHQQPRPVTGFEMCVSEGHLDCSIYLCQLIINQICLFKHVHILKATPLHWACYLGADKFLSLMIENGHDQWLHVRDRFGHMPIHLAAINGEDACLDRLLRAGALVNAVADCRSPLHIMYSSKVRPDKFLHCTKVLVRHGLDVNALDHNHNTPLDYLAWEYGQRVMVDTSATLVKYHYISGSYTGTKCSLSVSEYRRQLLQTMEVLLAGQAATVIYTSKGDVDHTVLHTLLQNTGWPLSSCLLKHPDAVYRAMQLLFKYGADPNLIAKNNNTSSLTMLLLHSLHEVQGLDNVLTYLRLFLLNGADLDLVVPPPFYFREHHADRLWSVHPVQLALQEKHPIQSIDLLFTYMHPASVWRIIHSRETKTWQTYMLSGEGHAAYRKEWASLRKRLLTLPRSLRHCCKLTILRQLDMRAVFVSELPLPNAVKRYLCDTEC